MNAYIYKITNPKNKVYIGSTINLKDRFYRYKSLRCKGQIKIYNSLKKYGFENHKFEVIFNCDEKDKYYYESYYGVFYNSLGENGLNLSLPKISDEVSMMSQKTKDKIGKAHKGKKISDEQKNNMLYNLKKYRDDNGHNMTGKIPWNKGIEFLKGELNPMFGIKRSDEWKKEHSKRMINISKKGENHPNSKMILDTYNGIFYYSLKEVSVYNNIIYSTIKSRLQKGNKRFIYC